MTGDSRTTRILFKWVGFVSAIWIQSIAGNNYTFANYASDLKQVLDYSQVELNTLSVAKDVGKGLGVLAGFFSDIFPPQVILLIGAGVGVVGYGSTWLIISQRVAPPALWQMCVVMFLGGNSSTWLNTACLTTCLRNFPGSRGPVTGILKGFVGLSTAIFTVVCSSLFTGSSEAFVLLLAVIPLVACMVGAVFLREVPVSTSAEEDLEEQTCFSSLNIFAIAIAVYLLAYTLAIANLKEAVPTFITRCVPLVLLMLLVCPIIVPAKLLLHDWFTAKKRSKKRGKSRYPQETDEAMKEPLLSKVVLSAPAEAEALLQLNTTEVFGAIKNKDEEQEEEGRGDKRPKELGDDHSLWEAMTSLDFWLLFLGFLTGVGAGMATINNVAQIGASLGFMDVTMYVSLISVFGFFGRLLSGSLSEYYLRSRAIPRTAWLAASKIPMIIGLLILAFPTPGALTISSIVIGACFGFHTTLIVPVASEMFGLKSFGIILNVLNLDMSLGSLLFSYVAGSVYDYEAQRTSQGDMPDLHGLVGSSHTLIWSDWMRFSRVASAAERGTECYGSHCFKLLFLVMSLVLALGFLVDIILTSRLRPLYKKLANFNLANSRGDFDRVSTEKPEV